MTFRLLDTPRAHLYKTRPLWVAALLFSAAAQGEMVNGAQLPESAQKVGENRYRTSEDFKAVITYYTSVYPPNAYPRKPIIHQPGIQAIHIVNPTGKSFEGLNIYEANDEGRIF